MLFCQKIQQVDDFNIIYWLRYFICRMNRHHRFYRHPNLLKPGPEQVTAFEPEQVWVADITYLPLRSGTAYLSLVTDACYRKIVGYHVGENLKTENVVKAFRKALRRRKTTGPLVHHSDRGLQYCSALYQSVHERNGITCSMKDGYDCYQNALAANKRDPEK
ncbi:Integrase core domain [Kluyvera intermedia]|nr:Integrase core domain [Kluyvera intermedia]